MHSVDKQEVQLSSFIKTANEITCYLRESRAHFKESLRNLEEQCNLREEANGEEHLDIGDAPNHTPSPNLSKYAFHPNPNEDMEATKIALNCPKCSVKLGIRVNSRSQSELLNAETPETNLFVLPCGDRGDGLECDKHACRMSSIVPFNPNPSAENNSMSYTILKGCNSSPESTVHAENRDSLIKARDSRSQISDHRKSIGKSTISLDTTATTAPNFLPLCKHACCQILGKKQSLVSRSQSFTLAPTALGESTVHDGSASVHGIHAYSKIQTPPEESIASGTGPALQSFVQDFIHPKMETLISSNLLNESISLIGIDKVDIAPLYDSSSATSFECDDESEIDYQGAGAETNCVECSLSHNAPVQSESSFGDSLKMENADQKALSSLSPEEYDILGYEIPEYRQDLYKDCFTLFIEKWFGRRDS